jgi:methylase of polypeptide subunit release factors
MEHTVAIKRIGIEGLCVSLRWLENHTESEKWDLVVSNPPHFFSESHQDHLNDLRRVDSQWHVHEEFYANVGRHLNKGASILFQENYMGSSEDTFAEMLRKNGLVLVDSLMMDTDRHRDNNKFFMWVKERGDGLWWRSDETRTVRVVASEILSGGRMSLQPGKYQVILVNDTDDEWGSS